MAPRRLLLVFFLLCLLAEGLAFTLDMESTSVCTRETPIIVYNYDIYRIYAQPPQEGKGTRDRCTIKFTGVQGQKFKIFTREMVFGECGINLKIYDGDMHLNQARYTFDCNSGYGRQYQTYSSEIAVSLEKADALSTSYKFFILLALENGPDIGGEGGEVSVVEGQGLTAGVTAGIVVAAVLVVVVIVAIAIYCFVVYRRKKEEKDLAKFLPPPSVGTATHDGTDSVHSSRHSTHSTHSTHVTAYSNSTFSYPAHRSTIKSISGPGMCSSLDTLSDNQSSQPKQPVRSVRREFEKMKKSLDRHERQAEINKIEMKNQEAREEARNYDRQIRAESKRGLGRTDKKQLALNAENIKQSLREARSKGRSYDESDSRFQRSSRSGSTRSSKRRGKSHSAGRSVESSSDWDYHSDRHDYRDRSRDRGRESTRNGHGRGTHRSASAGSMSRRRRDYYSDEEEFSDHHSRRHNDRQHHRHGSRDRGERSDNRSRRDSLGSRSGTQRSRSQSASRRHR